MWNTIMWNVVIGGSYCITGTIEREGREGVLIKDPVGRAAHVTRAPYSNANVFQGNGFLTKACSSHCLFHKY
jgi:hypothetical protein